MKIIRVFPTCTNLTPVDSLAFYGDPPMMRPSADEVHVSVTFTWDKMKAERLVKAWGQYYPIVKSGGPAYGCISHDFQPGMYLKQGVTFTTRGCNNQCPWCFVPEREGKLYQFDTFPDGFIIQDNNLLQSDSTHLDKVFDMLKTQPPALFSGGIDARLVSDDFANRLKSIRINQLFLAADTDGALKPLQNSIAKLRGLPRDKIRCYVLIGFNNETMEHAENRLKDVFNSGCLPYAMLYQAPTGKKTDWPIEWRHFARIWQRPAGMKTIIKNKLTLKDYTGFRRTGYERIF